MRPDHSSFQGCSVLRRFALLQKSELHLERQLDRAGAADLVQRRESAVLSPAAEEVVQRLCRFAELWRGQIVDRGAKVRMIQNIEEIASDLKREMFVKAKLPA